MEFPQPDGDLVLKVKVRVVTRTVIGYTFLALSKLQAALSPSFPTLANLRLPLPTSPLLYLVVYLYNLESISFQLAFKSILLIRSPFCQILSTCGPPALVMLKLKWLHRIKAQSKA